AQTHLSTIKKRPISDASLSAAKLLTKDEARRIAANIAKLPEKNADQLFLFPSGQRIVPVQNYTGNGATDVRFGSKADIQRYSTDVHFTPKSGHGRARSHCLLCAKGGHGRSFGSTLTCCSTPAGRVNANVEPWPGCASTQIRPPCISMMRLEIA